MEQFAPRPIFIDEGDGLEDLPWTAKLLGVPESWLRHGTRKKNPLPGRPPHIRIGRYIRYARADLRKFIENSREGGEG